MSDRGHIIDGRYASTSKDGLIYTEVLGWVDLGHARGDDIRKLLNKMQEGELSGSNYYDVTYSQGMNPPYKLARSGKVITWRIKHGRPLWERKSISLAMMMAMAKNFESFQSSFPNNFVTDSGFSAEDLVSDLLGFYRIVSTPNPFPLLKPVSKAKALQRWDRYGRVGSYKVYDFTPLLFPDPEKYPSARPRKGSLPSFMREIVPYNDFLSGNVILPSRNKTFVVIGTDNGRMGL